MKMFIGNLIYYMNEMELKYMFSPFVKILSSLIIKNQYPRRIIKYRLYCNGRLQRRQKGNQRILR